MSDKIKNPNGGYVLKTANFDKIKKAFHFQCLYFNKFNIEIPDFNLNEFFIERLREEPNFDLEDLCNQIDNIERMLLVIYYIYKRNPKDYNKLIELNQKLDNRLFFVKSFEVNKGPTNKSPNFDKLKKIWELYIPFPKLTNIYLNNYFIIIEKSSYNLQKILIRREKLLAFLKPYFTYPMVEEKLIEEIPIEKTTADISTQTINEDTIPNIDLKSPFLNKMNEEQAWKKSISRSQYYSVLSETNL